MDDSTESRYDIIIRKYLITDLGIDMEFSGNIIQCGKLPHQGWEAPMARLNEYDFKTVNGKMRPFKKDSLQKWPNMR